MKPVDLTIWNCHQLRRVDAIEFSALINFGTMSTKGRNSLLKMVRGAWVTSSAHTGIGLLAFKLLLTTDMWFLSGHNRAPAPEGFEEGIARLKEADKVAHTLAETQRSHYTDHGKQFMNFHQLKPQDHVGELLANYVASEEYQRAIAPLVAAIESRGTYAVKMAGPKSPHFRS
jgi:hypothetical protein